MTQVLAGQTDSYTGADVAAVCREAALAALEEDMEAAADNGAGARGRRPSRHQRIRLRAVCTQQAAPDCGLRQALASSRTVSVHMPALLAHHLALKVCSLWSSQSSMPPSNHCHSIHEAFNFAYKQG